MTSPGEVLENHTLIVSDGRIADLLPSCDARRAYDAVVTVERPGHVLLPGLVNAHAHVVPARGRAARPERLHDAAELRMAQMLRAGTTCFCASGLHPELSARAAVEQGMRALIGLPIAPAAGSWAGGPAECLTRALEFRDEYRDHPSIATAFAPLSPEELADETLRKIATLADELDAGIVMALHESHAEVSRSLARHGARPIERLQGLGLLTPALTAAHMVHVNASDIALARRGGVSVALCPQADFLSFEGAPPVASWDATGLRLGLGSGAAVADPWTELRLLALLSRLPDGSGTGMDAWGALAAATRGGAAALGLAEVGTLERGKWADLCCVDLRSPALPWDEAAPDAGPLAALVFNGGRDLVSDVWVCGRQLLNEGAYTRLDWPDLAARVGTWREWPTTGD